MVKKYIELDKAIRAVCDCSPHSCDFETDCAIGCQEAQALIKIPAADVVARDCYDRLLAENDELRKERPVVRCGECDYCEWKNEVCTYGWCKRMSTFKMRWEYCSDGERKDGDGE